MTVLMLAAKHSDRVARIILELESGRATLEYKSANQHTARDYARMAENHELAMALHALEAQSEAPNCPICQCKLKPHNKLRVTREVLCQNLFLNFSHSHSPNSDSHTDSDTR